MLDGTIRSAAVAGGVAAATVLALTAGETAAIVHTAEVCVLGAAVAVLCAGVFFYVYWHIGGNGSVAWLVAVAVAFALQKLNWFMLMVGDADGADKSMWVHSFQIVVTIVAGSLLVHSDRLPVRWDPLAVGMLLGLTAIGLRIAVLQIPSQALSGTGHAAVLAALGVVGLWNAARLVRAPVLSDDLRRQIAVAMALLTVGQVAAAAGSPETLLLLSAATNTAGSALLLTTAVIRVRLAIADEVSALRVLRGRLDRVNDDLHDGQARLHEIRATLAGLATASELLRRAEISAARREQLHSMTASELRRLDRLVSQTSAIPPAPTELDATLRPIIVRHEADGLPVSWQPSGQVAIARPDDVAEIVNILLSNAGRHAPGEPVHVAVRTAGDSLEVSVADSGPGIDPAVRSRLFTWGTHSSGSPGTGVGLAAARMLAEDLGGRLDLAPSSGRGARFLLSLPALAQAAPQDVSR